MLCSRRFLKGGGMRRFLWKRWIMGFCLGFATPVASIGLLIVRLHRSDVGTTANSARSSNQPERVDVNFPYSPMALTASYPVLRSDIRLPYTEPWPGGILLPCDFNGTKWFGIWDTGATQTELPDSLGANGRAVPEIRSSATDISGLTDT